MAFEAGTRIQRRLATKLEQGAVRTGKWGAWEFTHFPTGPGLIDGRLSTGWTAQVRGVYKNDLYVVLTRPIETEWGPVVHCAIRTSSNLEPPWRDKQRIKNELFGAHAVAVEVMPRIDELVDEADMYHMWVMRPGFRLPFTLYEGD